MTDPGSVSPKSANGAAEGRRYFVTAAIDFGTTFSCYAFSFNEGERKGDIIYNRNWGGRLNTESLKTPTCVLTDPSHQFHSFGYEAIAKYKRLNPEERKKYNMYSNYKQALHATQSFYGPATIKSSTEYERPAIDIFVMALNYLKEQLLKDIQGEAPHVTERDIQWVLCSPAIWSAPAKQFIRKVAKEAGLIDELLSSQLLLALEPEAAALFCRSVEMNHFTKGPQQLKTESGGAPSFRFAADTKFLLIDAGGGTVDITAYQLLDDGCLKELYPPSGGAWGGTEVDNNFIKLLHHLFGDQFVKKFQQDHPGPTLDILINFQRAKLDIGTKQKNDIKIAIPLTLYKAYGEHYDRDIGDVIKESKTGVTWEEDGMVIPYKVAKQMLFDPPVNKIVQHVTEMLNEHSQLQTLDYIMLVGGFGQCEILQEAVFSNFSSRATVLLPLEAQVAVIRGAVRFGQDPSQVASRIAGKTYGEDVYLRFNSEKHPATRKRIIDGSEYCKDCFRIYVKKGESIGVNEVREFISSPLYPDQTSVRKQLFSSDKEKPSFIDEEGVDLIGELVLPTPDTAQGTSRKIQSRVSFGGTELVVEITELTRDGSQVVTKHMDFLVY